MQGLPLLLKLAGERCLVVGGGTVAARKVELLVRTDARVRVVAPEFCSALTALAETHPQLTLTPATFEESHVDGQRLVVAATDDSMVNQRVFDACRLQGVLVNTVDTPELCTVTFPAIVDRDPVLIGISTSATSPTLAGWLRGAVERVLPANIGRLAARLGELRPRIRNAFPDLDSRRRFVGELIDGPFAEALLGGSPSTADARLENAFASARHRQAVRGDVALVGAGPGDPDLMTLRALRVLQRADVVLYDNLVNAAILDLARRDAEMIYVGKKRQYAAVRQDAINELLIEHAQAGRRVVRLKGGDPFIFGRGGEELERLAEAQVPFQVVPGITAASGCASYAGIPLTYRDISRSVRFITGHTSQGLVNLDWPELARPGQTLVIYMGLKGWPQIAGFLTDNGLSPETPAAVVENGTLPSQRCFLATVATLAETLVDHGVVGASLIIVGEVVRYRIVEATL